MRKITFENKLSSLDIKSKYVISSADINELKEIINSTADKILKKIELDKIKYRYIFIKLPKDIDRHYDIEIEASTDNWIDDISIIKLSSETSKFYVFSNGVFRNLENSYISYENSDKTIVINIQNLISNPGKMALRFRFRDLKNNLWTNYYSIDLNTNTKISAKNSNFIDEKFYTVADLKYKNHIANLINYGFDLSLILDSINYTFNEKSEIKLYSFIYNGKNIIDVTDDTLYLSDDTNNLNSSILELIKTKEDKKITINSSILYNGENLSNEINIFINPIVLSDIECSFSSINYVDEPCEISVLAKYSDQSFIDIKNDENFNLNIKNGNFSFNKETGILTPLNENSIDEITISYKDHDFDEEYVEKTYILKIKGKELVNIVGKIENQYLTSINNKTTYSVSAFYSDGLIEDITFNNNLEIIIFNNKEKDYNTLSLNKANAEITSNEVLFDDIKTIDFSFLDENTNQVIHTLNKIDLINSPTFSISGKIITSNGNNYNLIDFKSMMNSMEYIMTFKTDENMSDVKKIPILRIENLTYNDNYINFDPFEEFAPNEYYKMNIYLTEPPICNNLLVDIKSKSDINSTISFKNNKNATYKLEFYPISKIENAKFIKNCMITDIDKSFDENYVIGFKDIKFNLIERVGEKRNALELIEIYGIFESSNNYEFEKKFIYDEYHDIWIISDIPLKAEKLKSLKISIAYLD